MSQAIAGCDLGALRIFVFHIANVEPGEFSAAAANVQEARAAIMAELTDDQRAAQEATGQVLELLRTYEPGDRDPHMLPLGPMEFRNQFAAWQGDASYDLYDADCWTQHRDALKVVQDRVQFLWDAEREARKIMAANELKGRAGALGLTPQALKLIEAQQAQIARLEKALSALIDNGGDTAQTYEQGARDCYRVLNGY